MAKSFSSGLTDTVAKQEAVGFKVALFLRPRHGQLADT